jgi:hypothetical protein
MEKTNEAVHFGKMTHYIPENNLCLFQIYRQQNGYGPNEQQQRDQTIKTARFQESIKGYTTGKDILSDLFRHF